MIFVNVFNLSQRIISPTTIQVVHDFLNHSNNDSLSERPFFACLISVVPVNASLDTVNTFRSYHLYALLEPRIVNITGTVPTTLTSLSSRHTVTI